MATSLLNCAHCGGMAALVQWKDTVEPNATWVYCTSCGVMTAEVHHIDSSEAERLAAEAWNRRYNPPRKGLLDCEEQIF